MNRVEAPRSADAGSTAVPALRVAFLDNLRYLMVLLVVVYHAAGAYASVAPHWPIRDTTFAAADIIRDLFDVFMMPVLFFAAGYFTLPSLEKKGVWGFLKGKTRRLLIPWALAVLVFIPLLMYDPPDQLAQPMKPFRSYWLWYLGSFETRLRFTQAPVGPTTQMVYWFIWLLFAFFLLSALIYALARRWRGAETPVTRRAAEGGSPLVTLVLFGLLTTAGYFASLLLVPDSSWFTLHMFLEFQVTRLVLFAGCFSLGLYAQWRGWFAGSKPLGNLPCWAAMSVTLAAVYLVIGQPVFADTAGRAHLTAAFLLAFAATRSFLVLSVLVVLVSLGARYCNRSNGLDRRLAQASYNIYLTHFWLVVGVQGALVDWGGPAPLKAAIVLLAAVPLSFAVSRWLIGRWPRGFAIAILALFLFCLAVRP